MNLINDHQPHAAAHAELFFPVKYRLFHNNPVFQSNFNVGRSVDLSLNNLVLAVGRHNSINTRLDIELELPKGKSAYAIGKVTEGVDETINGIVHHFDKITFARLNEDAEDQIAKQINESNKKHLTKNR